ncbi:MAG TPA: glycosyltransferase [Casimicrobiaceae bacterium]|nr:glycosyltransferase [Casimicrobiaceae bacterium]
MNRNELCSCGSGKRFKHCCGRTGVSAPAVSPSAVSPLAVSPPRSRFEALAAHQAGTLGRAESLYRRALEENPGDIDSLHMLGVVHMQRLRYRESLKLLLEAAEKSNWALPQIRHNLGLVLGKLETREANEKQAELLARSVALERERLLARKDFSPLVTVVLPAYNHASFVGEAVASISAQGYPHIEVVVIDDGSTDATPAIITESLRSLRFPARLITRPNRGAAATLNEGAALAQGQYLAFLNSDDYYTPDRIECMVEEVARRGVPWGFSLVASADEPGEPRTIDILRKQRNFLGTQPNSFTLIEFNVAVSSGNLFVERDFFFSLGGFRDFRYNHDWDFCLRASVVAEPAVVNRPLYYYRFHAGNTIGESKKRATEDADRVLSEFLAAAVTNSKIDGNPLGPQRPESRSLLLKLAFRAGEGALFPVPFLRSLAEQWIRAPEPSSRSRPEVAQSSSRTAVVVLGMHRSGTSAFSRVLNLCGAYLPAKVKPPKLGVNPKGFWEPEAVLELDTRLMRQLGADWDTVDFDPPTAGDVVEEFDADARALLAGEYHSEPTILLKDPRISVLAPLWHRALAGAGYRPVYVVAVRHPVEVAQSLRARGDMSLTRGLQLWSSYMKRVVEFADGHPDVMFVTYTELLDDWRTVIARINERLGTRLDPAAHSDKVDHFLERGLRQQVVTDFESVEASTELDIAKIRSLYHDCLARCESANAGRSVATGAGRAGRLQHPGKAATLSFALCIENNSLRDQALLLCESIRRFAGHYAASPILAFAPRHGLGVDAATRSRLTELGVEYIDRSLNTTCLEYAPANRVFAGAYAEEHATTDFLAVLDSDTVWLDEPEVPVDADVAVRVVDSKGSATRGPGDRFEAYWARLAEICGVSLDRLPMVRSTIGNEDIRVSYNAGLTIARRDKGIFKRCAELFSASVEAEMKPYKGTGMNIVASTGEVGPEGSEYWGSSQAALTLAIWSNTDRVVHYPDHYNVPLHLVAADGEIDPRWLKNPPVHLHYHWMFDVQHHEVALELLAKLGLAADRLAWLAERIPFQERASARAAAKRSISRETSQSDSAPSVQLPGR